MSPTALRWCAVPLGLLGFALRLLDTFWLQPLTWHMSQGVLVTLGGMVVAAVIPFGILLLLLRGHLRPPARLVSGKGRFTAPATPVYACTQMTLFMYLSGGLVVTERVPNGDGMRVAEFPFAWPVTVIGVGFFWTVAFAFLFVQRPQVHLDPRGLTIRRLTRTTTIAWDEFAPGGPVPPLTRHVRRLSVYVNRVPMPAREDIPVGWLYVDPAFLARAIRHYVDNPQDRAGIGTEDGRDLLMAAPVPDR